MYEIHELERAECLRLLARTDFGRVAISGDGEVPMIRPINYLFDEASQSVVFRTAYGSKFHALLHSAKAAFEIDGVDSATRTGWSVIAVGTAELVSRPLELRRLEGLGHESWAPGPRPHWVSIRASTVSGRLITGQ